MADRNKFGIPIHVGPVSKNLLRQRISMIREVIDTGKSLDGRKLRKADVFKACLNLYTYRWQLKKMNGRKSSRKSA